MAQILLPSDAEPSELLAWSDFDFSELCCPRKNCASNDIDIIELPERPGRRWFGAGRAYCNHCGTTFALYVHEIE